MHNPEFANYREPSPFDSLSPCIFSTSENAPPAAIQVSLWYHVDMENNTSPVALSLETRLTFWKMAMVRMARVSTTLDMEIQALLDVIDGGMVGDDIVSEHGASLVTHMIANWPKLDEDPYLMTDGQADLLQYQPGMDWSKAGPHVPTERVVAALFHAGANPWNFKLSENEDGTLFVPPGETYPPFMFCLLADDTPRASFEALMAHPDCPSIDELMRYRTEKGATMLELAAAADGFALKKLLTLGADPNQKSSNGLPVIFRATSRATARLLVEAGADTDVLDGQGNSLAMHWALRNPSFASERIGVLPKSSKNDLHKVSLASLVAFTDYQDKSKLRSMFAIMRAPASYRWKVADEQVDLLEVLVSEAAFGPSDAKALAIAELLGKKNQWPEATLNQVAILGQLLKSSSVRSTGEAKILNAILEKREIKLSPESTAAAMDRLLMVRRSLRPTAPDDHLENKVKQDILYTWSDWLDRTVKNDPQGSEVLSVFQGFKRAILDIGNPGIYFVDISFRKMLAYAKEHDMGNEDWLFWTAMGISSGSLGQPESWEVWEQTAQGRDQDWFKDPLISRAISLRRNPELSSRLDQILLRHSSPATPSISSPSRRL